MYFPVSGVEVFPLLPPAAAFLVSFFASMGGISGAFLLLPFQVSVLGYASPSVSATNQFYNVVAIPGGVWRYIREGRMLWPLAATVAAGTLPGVFAGALIRAAWLPDPKTFTVFAGLVLLYIGLRLVRDLARSSPPAGPGQAGGKTRDARQGADDGFQVRVLEFSLRRIRYSFEGRDYGCSTAGVCVLSLVVGVVGGAYGIGGGAIMAPFLVSWFRLPVHTISGATLMGTFLTSVAGVAFYTLIAPLFPGSSLSPDWLLGLLFGLGGAAGMYLGARCQKHVPARAIKWMLALVILGTAGKYVLSALG